MTKATRKTINELLDFAEKTKQMGWSSSIIQFYEGCLKHKSEPEAFKETIKTYDLSWHHDYMEVFYNYNKELYIDKVVQIDSAYSITGGNLSRELIGKAYDKANYSKFKTELDRQKDLYKRD